MRILEFLFGKPPRIFNKKGEVSHNLDEKKISDWKKIYTSSPEKNWRQHVGRQSIFEKKK